MTTATKTRLAAVGGASALGLAAALLLAPVDPRTLPKADLGGITLAGMFSYDWPDGAGGDLSYGAGAMGVRENGTQLYISCVQDDHGIAILNIPAIGGRATVAAPCQGPNRAELAKVHPDPTAFRPMLGGVLEQAGRLTVTGYISYDASGGTTASHWGGASLTALTGPFPGTVSAGLTGGPMAPIPAVWQSALGGTALTSLYLKSIVSRSSYGFTASVFNPADVGVKNPIPMKLLVGCRHTDPGCNTYQNDGVGKDQYQGAELAGGYFIVPGTRTLIAVEREADGPACYGYTTRNQALHGTPYPGPGYDAQHVVWCYSLSDPVDEKGPKGYPYRNVMKAYDLNDLADVAAGTKQPWTVRQYATVSLPDAGPGDYVQSGAYNPVRNEFYLVKRSGPGVNTVFVYRGFAPGTGTPPPAPTDCIPGTESMVSDDSATASCDVQPDGTGRKTILEQWTRTGDVPESNGGKACLPVVTPRTRYEPCPPTPPPPADAFVATLTVSTCVAVAADDPPDATGGWGVQFILDGTNLGTRDTTKPYTKSRSGVAIGAHTFAATWTKTGATPVVRAPKVRTCTGQ